MTSSEIEFAKLVLSGLALVGALIPATIAVRTFRRTDAWKRAEFLAREMKEFFDDPRVQNAFTLIDWGTREVPLLDENAENEGRVRVTRPLQVRALLPHTLVNEGVGSDKEQTSRPSTSSRTGYTTEEVAIRDCYDAFLDGLERFSSYVRTGLVDAAELRPYLGYWIDDIHGSAGDADDAAWSAALLTYIHFYRYFGVQWLFRRFGRAIDPKHETFRGFLAGMSDQTLAAKLAGAAGVAYERGRRAR